MTWSTAAVAALAGVGPLLIGAGAVWARPLPRHVVAGVMAFGSGLLIATLAYELAHDAFSKGGVWPVLAGMASGALVYVGGDTAIAAAAKKRAQRKAESTRNATDRRGGGSSGGGIAYAVGATLDGVPEALVIGISAATGGFPAAAVIAIGLSNVAEGLAGTVPLRKSGKPARLVFGLWGAIVAVAMAAAVAGAVLMSGVSGATHAVTLSFAAGALLAMVVNAMIPEAVETDHSMTGLLAAAGFVVAFAVFETF